MNDRDTTEQEFADRFYFANGPCCSGCDWWARIGSTVGECRRHAPVPAVERFDMIGISSSSMRLDAGHPLTKREHYCGDFKDDFDWSSLPLPYRKLVGAPV